MRRALLLLTLFLGMAAPASAASISVSGDSESEGAGAITFNVTASGIAPGDSASVDYETVAGTALDGVDYSGRGPSTLTFHADGTRAVHIPIIDDDFDEADESFTLVLSNAFGAKVDTDTATGTILDDDDPP
jgi:hypothetical protein